VESTFVGQLDVTDSAKENETMRTEKIVCWRDKDAWIGYFQDYPDYWTQGKSQADLKRHLKDLYKDLTRGKIPGIRKVEEITVS
jgi:predicted RNase H-like HicB family nuclease